MHPCFLGVFAGVALSIWPNMAFYQNAILEDILWTWKELFWTVRVNHEALYLRLQDATSEIFSV